MLLLPRECSHRCPLAVPVRLARPACAATHFLHIASSSSEPSHFRFNFGGPSLPLPAPLRPPGVSCWPRRSRSALNKFCPAGSVTSIRPSSPLSRPQPTTQTCSPRLEVVLPANKGLTIYVACIPNCSERAGGSWPAERSINGCRGKKSRMRTMSPQTSSSLARMP